MRKSKIRGGPAGSLITQVAGYDCMLPSILDTSDHADVSGETSARIPNTPTLNWKFPNSIRRADASRHWYIVRELYKSTANKLMNDIKAMEKEPGDRAVVAYGVTSIIDSVANNNGQVVFGGKGRYHMGGIHLNDAAKEKLAVGLSLRCSTVDNDRIVKVVNSARSWISQRIATMSMVEAGWMLGNIRLKDDQRPYLVDENRMVYLMADQKVVGVTSHPNTRDTRCKIHKLSPKHVGRQK